MQVISEHIVSRIELAQAICPDIIIEAREDLVRRNCHMLVLLDDACHVMPDRDVRTGSRHTRFIRNGTGPELWLETVSWHDEPEHRVVRCVLMPMSQAAVGIYEELGDA